MSCAGKMPDAMRRSALNELVDLNSPTATTISFATRTTTSPSQRNRPTPRIERQHMSDQGNGGNYPSTTGNPSGGGRGNGPRGK